MMNTRKKKTGVLIVIVLTLAATIPVVSMSGAEKVRAAEEMPPEEVVSEELMSVNVPLEELLSDEMMSEELLSEELLSEDETEDAEMVVSQEDYQQFSPGDLYTIGSYEQDGDETNGPEDISWIILDVQPDQMLLLSANVLESRPYDEEGKAVTWAKSAIRRWLNQDFYETAFQGEEKDEILLSSLSNPDNATYKTSGGETTEDKIFLLSREEARQYLGKELLTAYAAGTASPYAIAHGCWTADAEGHCWWWLRSPGRYADSAAGVGHTGIVGDYGTTVSRASCGVRPAMWICIPEPEIPSESIEEEDALVAAGDNLEDDLIDEDMMAAEDDAQPEITYESLQYGDNGQAVADLQTALIAAGVLNDVADGQFGPNTYYAVQRFQEAAGFEVTGIADDATQKAIYDYLEQMN